MKLSVEQQNVHLVLAGMNTRDDLEIVDDSKQPNRQPSPISRSQQLTERAINGSLTEGELPELEALCEQDKGEENGRIQELHHLSLAGLIDSARYNALLLVEVARPKNKKPLLESDDPKEKRAAIWERQRRGELTISEATEQAAKIRLAEEHAAKPRWLREIQCSDPCECRDCDLSSCRSQLDEAIANGQMSKAAADDMWKARLAMD
jgi:hypothetical protein